MVSKLSKFFLQKSNIALLASYAFLAMRLCFGLHPVLGWFGIALFGYGLTPYIENFLFRVFALKRGNWMTASIALVIGYQLLTLISGVFTTWYRLTEVGSFVAFVVTSIIVFIMSSIASSHKRLKAKRTGLTKLLSATAKSHATNLPFNKVIGMLFVISLGFWLYAYTLPGPSASMLLSPWQSLGELPQVAMAISTLLLWFLIFSRAKIGAILLAIVAHAMLLHSYLPFSYELPWGGDVWRMVSVEQHLAGGGFQEPVLFGEGAKWVDTGLLYVPEVLTKPHKYVYGHLWGSTVLLHHTLGVSVLNLNIWLGPIVWSLMLPLLLFRLGRIIFGDANSGLVLAGLSVIPFIFQAQGALSLAVGYDFVLFLLFLVLYLQQLRDGHRMQRYFLMFLWLLSLFSYPLYSILGLVLIIFSLHLPRLFKQKKTIKNLLLSIYLALSIFLIPIVELASGTSRLANSFGSALNLLKQNIGQFTGWFYATEIRPHDITGWNIFFNHTPDYSFVATIFTDFRFAILIFVALLLVLCLRAIFLTRKISFREPIAYILLWLGFCIGGGYVFGWSFLQGDLSFVRRMDLLLALTLIVLMLVGSRKPPLTKILTKKDVRVFKIFLSFGLAYWSVMSFASGPDMRVMSKGEYDIGKELSQKNVGCVLADTWELLSLETHTNGRLVGGGFKMDHQFGQKERVELFESLKSGEVEDLSTHISTALVVPKQKCIIAIKRDQISLKLAEKIKQEGLNSQSFNSYDIVELDI